LTELLGSELNRLAALFLEACEGRRRHRDHSRHELHEVLREVAACFPVYRSYVRPAGRASTDSVSEEDVRYVQAAVERAKSERDDLDPELFELLERILLLREPGERQAELAVRFQQLTGPAMAKGVEDTAFYRYHRLAAACEVGADPGAPAVSVEAFHAACRRTAHDWPRAMLATSTHDTKRSEDVRARLALLSEIPDRWREAVARWSARDARLVRDGAPDPSLRYLLYQTMVGAWPLERERLVEYAQKAAREAKMHTAWTHIDEAYETALEAFISGVYDDRERLADLEAFVAPLVEPGRINALAQTLVKLTTPGVPDIYQGCEVWDLSLVDPDNRRPVDFARRETLLTELMRAHAERVDVEAILARTEEGAPKMWVIHRALELRRARPHAFREDYVPLEVEGSASDHVLAFARGDEIITIVPRLGLRFAREHGGDWGDTALTLPAGDYDNCLTGECLTGEPLSVARTRGGAVRVADVLSRFPVALLARRGGR
jgi:(1->4)-alpha-D-glucan 1-alpha-D-glucosylmutase